MNKLFLRRVRVLVVSLCVIGGAMLLPAAVFAQQSENIHIAVLQADYDAVKGFLDDGVSPDSFNSTGFAPLHSAARANRADIVVLLLSYDGDVNIQSRTRIDPAQGGLHIAARNGYRGLVELLLSRGADPNIQDSRGNTPLHDAAISGDVTVARALVRGGADVTVRNSAGEDVLAVAAESLGAGVFSRNQFAIPITISSQIDFDDLTPSIGTGLISGLLRSDVEIGFSALFPLGESIVFIGPEVGVSIPIVPLFAETVIIRIPLRAVMSFAFNYNVSLDLLVGTEFNIWSDATIQFADLTFDIGARVDLSGFLLGLNYTLPVAVALGEPQFTNVSGTGVRSYTEQYWQNALTLSLGYRIRL